MTGIDPTRRLMYQVEEHLGRSGPVGQSNVKFIRGEGALSHLLIMEQDWGQGTTTLIFDKTGFKRFMERADEARKMFLEEEA